MYRQAQYIQKAPLSETRIVDYNRKRKLVTIKYKRKDYKKDKSVYILKTMHALELIARLIQHIHYPKMHYTRYFGQYSVKRRGMRRKQEKKANHKEEYKYRKEYRSSWARLIWKVYRKNPLKCPFCNSNMRIEKIVTENTDYELKHLDIRVWYYKEEEKVCEVKKRGP